MPELLSPPTEEEQSVAEHVAAQIEIVLSGLTDAEDELSHSYARLGSLLLKTQQEKLWLLWGHKSFGEFLKTVEPRVKRGRSQIYAIIGVADKLLPLVPEEDLAEMGISKAQVLHGVLKAGKPVTESMISKALDPKVTAQELRAAAFEEAHIVIPENESQKYFDMKGFYASAEERKEIERATETAVRVIGIGPEVDDHVRWKAVVMAWVAEFLSTHEAGDA